MKILIKATVLPQLEQRRTMTNEIFNDRTRY